MTAKQIATALLLALSLAAPATANAVTLVDSTGAPVGGIWQRWADASKVPTIPGNLTVQTQSPGNVECGGPPACSMSSRSLVLTPTGVQAPWQGQPTITYLAANATRAGLDMELGHQFDWALLTTANRRKLARLMEQWGGRLSWWDGEAALSEGMETGLEGLFATDYAACAKAPLHGTVDPRICALIASIGSHPLG